MYINLDSTNSVDGLLENLENNKDLLIKSVMNVPKDYVKPAFQNSRVLYGKDSKIQAHIIVQRFKEGVTAEQANSIGMEILGIVADGFQGVVYTTKYKGCMQNEIVINAVGLKNGLKYRSDKRKLYLIRRKTEELASKCQ